MDFRSTRRKQKHLRRKIRKCVNPDTIKPTLRYPGVTVDNKGYVYSEENNKRYCIGKMTNLYYDLDDKSYYVMGDRTGLLRPLPPDVAPAAPAAPAAPPAQQRRIYTQGKQSLVQFKLGGENLYEKAGKKATSTKESESTRIGPITQQEAQEMSKQRIWEEKEKQQILQSLI